MNDDFWESKLISRRGHLKYLEKLRNLSRNNRKELTKTERFIWYEILSGRKTEYKFLRQKPIGKFILDFYCKELLLAIEIDGGYHEERKYVDEERDKFLRNLNIETLRISTNDILHDSKKARSKILTLINERKVSLFKGKTAKRKGFEK